VEPPVAMPTPARDGDASRSPQRAATRGSRRRDLRERAGHDGSPGTCVRRRAGSCTGPPPSTPSSSTGTAHCTSGTTGTLPCTTRISGSKARPLDGERDRRGGLRERTVRIRGNGGATIHSVDPLGSPEVMTPGCRLITRRCRLPLYASTARSASVDPSRERPDDRERPGGPLRIPRAHDRQTTDAMPWNVVGPVPMIRWRRRPVVTNRAMPAHPRARDDREPALLRACLHDS
jgi:hypothetical protein